MNYDGSLLSKNNESSNPILIESAESIQSELLNQVTVNSLQNKEVSRVVLKFTNEEKANIK